MNNKMIKGSVAGATGIVLLMGGFGTYALWSDSSPLTSGSINSGSLDIGELGTAVWTNEAPVGGASGTWVPGTDKMVPGDHVKMVRTVPLSASGKNLKVEFLVSGITKDATWTNLEITGTYSGDSLSVTADDNNTPENLNDDLWRLTKTYNPSDIAGVNDPNNELVLNFKFLDDGSETATGVTGTEQQNEGISLSGMTVSVNQVRS